MAVPLRRYPEALSLLARLPTNRAVVKMIQQSDTDINMYAIPEMLEWVCKAGYAIEDFNALKVIHVAGTKGKGSVCAMVESILKQYGRKSETAQTNAGASAMGCGGVGYKADLVGKIGLYTSPHLITVRERIRINGEPISELLFASHFFALWDRFSMAAAAAGDPNPTSPDTKPGFFRYLTIMALHVFLQEGVRTAIVECGIGGEYDSTNVLRKEAFTVTAITKLGIDHVGMLGNTIQKIAWHKGGIMKQGIKCFTVQQDPGAMGVLNDRAKEKGAFLSVAERREEIENGSAKVRLEGVFQKENANLAVSIAGEHLNQVGLGGVLQHGKLSTEVRRGLEEVEWAGRCEVMYEGNIEWCIDGAHTMDSIKETAEWFAAKLRGVTVGQAMLIFNQQDRDAVALVRTLHLALEQQTGARHIFGNAVFCSNTPFKSKDQTGLKSSDGVENLHVQNQLADAWSGLEPDTEIDISSTVEEAVEKAREVSKDREKLLVLVTGSLHLVGAFLKVQNASLIHEV